MKLHHRLDRLDRMPPLWAGGVGALAGLVIAWWLVSVSPVLGTLGFLLLLLLAGWFAYSAEPIPVELVAPRKEQPPSAAAARPIAKTSAATPVAAVPEIIQAEPRPAFITEIATRVEPKLTWVCIPAGSFFMGSNEYESEQPVHQVSLSVFECMSIPVTRRLYHAVMGNDPAWPKGEADDRPVNNVSWLKAIEFCNAWSQRDNLSVCYQIDSGVVSFDPNQDGYRLLTEAQWEYACRAGSQTRWCFGDDERRLDDYAWFAANAQTTTHPVAQKEANAWGLHDMHGNVWEWCWDWYAPYTQDTLSDPAGPNEGKYRVLRGGAFDFEPGDLRSAVRFRNRPEFGNGYVGLRCARPVRRQHSPSTH